MNCSNDQVPLHAAQSDVFSCQRCRSRAYVGDAFSEIYPGIREILIADDRGGRGRRSACPKCNAIMQPMRLGRLEAWLDACDSCQLLWVERLNDNVVRGLKERWRREYAMSSRPASDRAELATGLAAGTADHEREMRSGAATADRIEGTFDIVGDAFDLVDFLGDLFD